MIIDEIKPKVELIDILKQRVQPNITQDEAQLCKNVCEQVKIFSREIGDCFEAKLLWYRGDEEEAIELLDETSSSDALYLKAYSLVFKYLKLKNKSKLLRKIGKAMVSRCKVFKFSVSV